MVVIEFVCSADVMKQTIASETGFFKKSSSSIESLATDFIHDCKNFCDKHFAQTDSFFLTYSSHSVDQALRELRSGPMNMIPFRGADSTLQKKILNDWLLANKDKADSAPRFICVLPENWAMESTIEPIIESPELLKGPVFISKIHGKNAECSSIEHPSLTLSGSVIGATELNYSLTQINAEILSELQPLGLSEATDQSTSISVDTDNTPAKPENRLVDLVLTDTSLSKIEAVRTLRKILSMELSEAAATMESLPTTIRASLDRTIASSLSAKLESAGFSASLVSTAPDGLDPAPAPVQQSTTSDEFSHDGKTNLKTLEGSEEVFVDKLEDEGVFDLRQGKSREFGTYRNSAVCIQSSTVPDSTDPMLLITTSVIRLDLYQINHPAHLKLIKYTVDGELNDIELFWFDQYDNDLPSEHNDWSEIKENLDIFEDELED